MIPSADWLLYGAYGYTGELIAREAVRRGLRPILAGRKREAVERLAAELGCEHRVFAVAGSNAPAPYLLGARAVLNCAGPFSATAAPLMDACLEAGLHYLDITGEIDVIEAAASRHQRAVERGIALIPSVGFDVVPSDCLAAILAARLPDATHLQLAFAGGDQLSPGTLKTIVENIPQGGRVRIAGRIERVPLAWKEMRVPFRDMPRWAMTIPWGDVASAYHSTGIKNIEVYAAAPRRQIKLLRRIRRPLSAALRIKPLRRFVQWRVRQTVRGPAEDVRLSGRSQLWGRVTNAAGRELEATLTTPEAYQLTVLTSLAALERVLAGTVASGFSTPSKAFGKELILQIPGVEGD